HVSLSHAYSLHLHLAHPSLSYFFFFNDPATTEIYTLSLHDALPILRGSILECQPVSRPEYTAPSGWTTFPAARPATISSRTPSTDRKSTRLNSSHSQISYAVFCLKKKKKKKKEKKKRIRKQKQ